MLTKHHLVNSDARCSKKHFSDIRNVYESLLYKTEKERSNSTHWSKSCNSCVLFIQSQPWPNSADLNKEFGLVIISGFNHSLTYDMNLEDIHFKPNATDDYIQNSQLFSVIYSDFFLQIIIKYPIMTSLLTLSSTLLDPPLPHEESLRLQWSRVKSKVLPAWTKNDITEPMVFYILYIRHWFKNYYTLQ